MKKEKVYVYIGRFQMAHEGHEAVLEHAIKNADRVVVLVGSSEIARDPKNPFTFEERKSVLDAMTTRLAEPEWANNRNVHINILPVHDYVYNNTKWLSEVQKQVKSVTKSTDIVLTGCRKKGDTSTEYLNYFQWEKDFIDEVQNETATVSSTEIRNQYFSSRTVSPTLPVETIEFLQKFPKNNPEVLEQLVKEFNFVTRYKQQMIDTLPYTNIPFLTGDSLVVCSGHVLLVKRRTEPGKGLLALPGGFFDAWKDQDQVETALRELKEETKIDVRFKELKGSIARVEEFGDFNRSQRWRIITKCVYIKLDGHKLPKVKGSDDAEKALWVPIGDLVKLRDQFFEDHLSIIDTFLGIL